MSETTNKQVWRRTLLITLVVVLAMSIVAAYSAPPNVVIERGSNVEPEDYIIFTDGSSSYGKSGSTGEIAYSGSDTAAIAQSMVNSGAKSIKFTGGTFNFADTVNGTSNLIVSGAGRRATVLNMTTANKPILSFAGTGDSDANRIHRITVSDLCLQGYVTDTARDVGLNLTYVNGATVERVDILKTNEALFLKNVRWSSFTDMTLEAANRIGIHAVSDAASYADENVFTNVNVWAWQYVNNNIGVLFDQKATGYPFRNWRFERVGLLAGYTSTNTTHVRVLDSGGDVARNIVFDTCRFQYAVTGFLVEGIVQDFTVRSCAMFGGGNTMYWVDVNNADAVVDVDGGFASELKAGGYVFRQQAGTLRVHDTHFQSLYGGTYTGTVLGSRPLNTLTIWRGTLSAGSTTEFPVWRVNEPCTIIKVGIIPSANITGDNTNYSTLSYRLYRDGSLIGTIASKAYTSGVDATAYTYDDLGAVSSNTLSAGDVVSFRKAESGSGMTVYLTLYVEYTVP